MRRGYRWRRGCGVPHAASTTYRVIPGFHGPRLYGEGFRHETRGGTRIQHPSAYAKRGWSNMIYVAASYEIVVGAGWLANRVRHET
jgi:hypothetical protein